MQTKTLIGGKNGQTWQNLVKFLAISEFSRQIEHGFLNEYHKNFSPIKSKEDL